MFVYKKSIFHHPYYTTEMQYLSTYFCVIYKSFWFGNLKCKARRISPILYSYVLDAAVFKKRLGRSCVYRYAPINCEQSVET